MLSLLSDCGIKFGISTSAAASSIPDLPRLIRVRPARHCAARKQVQRIPGKSPSRPWFPGDGLTRCIIRCHASNLSTRSECVPYQISYLDRPHATNRHDNYLSRPFNSPPFSFIHSPSLFPNWQVFMWKYVIRLFILSHPSSEVKRKLTLMRSLALTLSYPEPTTTRQSVSLLCSSPIFRKKNRGAGIPCVVDCPRCQCPVIAALLHFQNGYYRRSGSTSRPASSRPLTVRYGTEVVPSVCTSIVKSQRPNGGYDLLVR